MVRRVLAQLLVTAALALPSSFGGITPLTPKEGAKVPEGTQPVFTGKAKGPGSVWIHVSTSNKVGRAGVIRDDALLERAHRKRDAFRLKAPFFDFPEFWLNTPGRYFWQAYRIVPPCDTNAQCYRPGPIVRFKVVD